MRTAALWGLYSRLYDGLLEVHAYRDMIEQVVDAAAVRDLEILDAGAGTGNVSRAMLDAGAKRVVAVDLSADMLDRAEVKLQHALFEGRAEIVLGDLIAAMTELPDSSVDRITAVNVLYTLRDRTLFFGEAARVLRPGGFLIAAHTTRSGSAPIFRDQMKYGGLRSVLRPKLLSIALIDLLIDLLARGGRYQFVPVPELSAEAAAAGLTRTVELGRCYGYPEGVNALLRISR